MNLKQLTSFASIVAHGGISRASAETGVGQNVLKRGLAELEGELGAKLFVRQGRHLVLTEAGSRLHEHCVEILQQADSAHSQIMAIARSPSAMTILGMPPTIATVLASPIATAFHSQFPEARLRFVDGMSGLIREWLAAGTIDIGVVYETPGPLGEELWQEELLLVGSEPPARLSEDSLDFRRLSELRLVLPSPHHGLRKLVDGYAHQHGVSLQVLLEADSLNTILDLVGEGFGYSILPLVSITNSQLKHSYWYVPITRPAITRKLLLATSTSKPVSQASRALLNIIREEVRAYKESRCLLSTTSAASREQPADRRRQA